MSTRVLFLLGAFGFFSSANCQEPDFSYKWGVKLDAEKSLFSARIVGLDSSGIFVLKERPNSSQVVLPHLLERFDHRSLNLTKSMMLNIKEGKEKCIPEQVIRLRDKLFLFYSITNRSDRRIALYARELDKKTLEPGNGKKIGDIAAGKQGIPKGRFSCRMSVDSSRILFMRNVSQRGDKTETVWVTMLDASAEMLWEKVVSLPVKFGALKVESIRVSADGSCYLLGRSEDAFELIAIQHNGDSVTRYPIQLDGLALTSVQIEMVGESDLYCAGFFSARRGLNARGAYFINVDVLKKELKARSLVEFDAKFILQNLSKQDYQWSISRSEQGEKAELFQTSLDRILIGKNGGIYLIGEQHYQYANAQYYYAAAGGNYPQRTNSNRGSIVANQNRLSTPQPYQLYNSPNALKNYHFVYNDIVVVKLNPDGQVAWTSKIYKSQNTVDDNGFYSSYLLSFVNDQIHFLFNDHPKNENPNSFERPAEYAGAKANLVMVSVDRLGNQQRHVIHEYTDLDVTIIPKMSEQVSDHGFILFGQRRLQEQLTMLRFK